MARKQERAGDHDDQNATSPARQRAPAAWEETSKRRPGITALGDEQAVGRQIRCRDLMV
jgi:hypothetical protein